MSAGKKTSPASVAAAALPPRGIKKRGGLHPAAKLPGTDPIQTTATTSDPAAPTVDLKTRPPASTSTYLTPKEAVEYAAAAGRRMDTTSYRDNNAYKDTTTTSYRGTNAAYKDTTTTTTTSYRENNAYRGGEMMKEHTTTTYRMGGTKDSSSYNAQRMPSVSSMGMPLEQVSRYYSDRTLPVRTVHGGANISSPFTGPHEGFPPLPSNYDIASVSHRAWRGPETVVSTEARTAGGKVVLNEYTIEREIVVPRKQIREDVIEKTYVVPERIVVEEVVEDTQMVIEKIVEVATPVIREKIVEVPVYNVIERTVEVPQTIIKEKIVEVPKIQIMERIVEVPKIIPQERIVEVPVVEYRDVPCEKIVEIPEVREEIVYKEVRVPRYVEKPVKEEKIVEVEEERCRLIPVPMESNTYVEFVLPKIRTVYNSVQVPVYVPRFVEVPVCAEFCDQTFLERAEQCHQTVTSTLEVSQEQVLSLSALEQAADLVKEERFEEQYASQKFVENFAHWWSTNQLIISEASIQSICRTSEQDGSMVLEAVSLLKQSSEAPANTPRREDVAAIMEEVEHDVGDMPECVESADDDDEEEVVPEVSDGEEEGANCSVEAEVTGRQPSFDGSSGVVGDGSVSGRPEVEGRDRDGRAALGSTAPNAATMSAAPNTGTMSAAPNTGTMSELQTEGEQWDGEVLADDDTEVESTF